MFRSKMDGRKKSIPTEKILLTEIFEIVLLVVVKKTFLHLCYIISYAKQVYNVLTQYIIQ